MCRLRAFLDEDLYGGLGRAALADELDRPVQVSFAAGEALGERKGIARLHQHVQPPALDL